MLKQWMPLCLAALIGLSALEPVEAAQPRPGVSTNPLGSPIRRINPNSRQGTVPSNPAQRQGQQAMPPRQAPTLENRGIGNGQPASPAYSQPARPLANPAYARPTPEAPR
jgi:hypothetical protein